MIFINSIFMTAPKNKLDALAFNVMATELYEHIPPVTGTVHDQILSQQQVDKNHPVITAKFEEHVNTMREKTSKIRELMKELKKNSRNAGMLEEMAHIEEYLTLKKRVNFNLVADISLRIRNNDGDVALLEAFLDFLKTINDENTKFFKHLISSEYTTGMDDALQNLLLHRSKTVHEFAVLLNLNNLFNSRLQSQIVHIFGTSARNLQAEKADRINAAAFYERMKSQSDEFWLARNRGNGRTWIDDKLLDAEGKNLVDYAFLAYHYLKWFGETFKPQKLSHRETESIEAARNEVQLKILEKMKSQRAAYLGQLVFKEWAKRNQPEIKEMEGIEKATASGTVPNKSTSPRQGNINEWDSAVDENASSSNAVGRKTV